MKLLTKAEESQQITDERTLLDAVDNSASADTISHLLSSSISSQISDVFTTTNYVEVLGYHSKGDGGGGKYYYSSSTNRNLHNGGTIIDPTRTFPTDWANETQKTTWFTASTGTGCWLRLGNNNSIDGRCFGVKFDNLTTPITDNTKALQKAVDNVQTIWLPGGKYKVISLRLRDKTGLLALNSKIHLITTASYLMYATGTGDVTGVEFHGILESTLAGTDGNATGLIRVLEVNGTVSNWNLRGVEYISVGFCQGILLVPAAANGTRSWIKDIDARDSTFTCGGMGVEAFNHDLDLIITNITIGANAIVTVSSAGIWNYDTAPILVEGQTICFVGVLGSGAVSKLNGKFFRVHKLTNTTFNIMLSDGSYYDTTGGSYTFASSNGNDNVNSIYVYRLERLNLSGSVFKSVGTYTATPPPTPETTSSMGISLSGALLNCNLSDLHFYYCITSAIELVGCSYTTIRNVHFYNCIGDLLVASNYRIGFYNTIQGLKTIGQDTYNGIEISRQYKMLFSDCSLVLKKKVYLDGIQDSTISNCYIKSLTLSTALNLTSNDSSYHTKNNLIFDCILDTSEQVTVNSPLEFSYPYCYNNTADRMILNPPSALSSNITQWGGAANNTLVNWRYPTTATAWEPPPTGIITTNGLVSTFASENISDDRKLVKRSFFGTGITFTLEAVNSNGGQPSASFEITYGGRKDDSPVGGKILVHFGTYSSPTVVPRFDFIGSGNDVVYSGTATLVAGEVQVNNGNVLTDSRIELRGVTPGGTVGALFLYSKTAYANFVVRSTSATDTSTFYWEIRNPTVKPTITYSGLNGSNKPYWTLLFNDTSEIDILLTANIAPANQSSYSIGTV